MKPTPREKINRRRKKLKYGAINFMVMLCALAGVVLAEPWQAHRRGEVPVYITPDNLLEVIFSIIGGLSLIYGLQEHGGKDLIKKNSTGRVFKRCLIAFLTGAGVGSF